MNPEPSTVEQQARSQQRLVSPWIRAALAHGLRRLAPRGGDGVRSDSEVFPTLSNLVVVPNNCTVYK